MKSPNPYDPATYRGLDEMNARWAAHAAREIAPPCAHDVPLDRRCDDCRADFGDDVDPAAREPAPVVLRVVGGGLC